MLNAGKKVAMLVGAGALHATDEVIAVADVLGAGVAKALLGKAAVPDELPFVTGSIGLLGTQAELGDDERVRHAADGRLALPVFRIPAARKDRRAACRSTSTRKMLRCAIRWRSTSSATAPTTLRALLPLLEAQDRPRLAREIE